MNLLGYKWERTALNQLCNFNKFKSIGRGPILETIKFTYLI